MWTNCGSHLADLCLYFYEDDFIPKPPRKNEKKIGLSLNSTLSSTPRCDWCHFTKYWNVGDYDEHEYDPIVVTTHNCIYHGMSDATNTKMKSTMWLPLGRFYKRIVCGSCYPVFIFLYIKCFNLNFVVFRFSP